MPVFRYRGYNTEGKEVSGTLRADGEGEAILRLKESGIFPKELEEHLKWKKPPLFQLVSPQRTLPHFTRQLATLLSSSVPLSDALRSIGQEYSGYWHGIVLNIAETVSEGASLSRAIGAYPDIFPEYYRNMLAASEMGGNLPEVLETLAEFLETDTEIRTRARTAMLYPAFMIVVSVFVLSFVFTFVIPKIIRIFRESSADLPLITEILIKISALFHDYWWLMLGGIAGVSYILVRFHRLRPHYLHRLFILIPITRALAYSRFTATLGFLLRGGVPIIRALELSSGATGNAWLEEIIAKARNMVTEGKGLSESLTGLSPVLLQMISTGEKSGQLPELLIRASESYKKEFIRQTEQITSILEPVMILVMGIIVGFIVFGVLLPIFEINQIIR